MNESFNNEAPHPAKKQLLEACRTKDTSRRVAWAITVGEALLLGVLAVALADYWLMLPVGIRLTGAGIITVLALFGISRLIRFYRMPTPLKEAALDVEAAKPELGCEISTAAEYLSGERKTTQEYEPELVAALEARAAEDLRATHVPYERKLLRPAVVLFVTLLCLLVSVVVAPVALTALTRAALPLSKAHYTRVKVSPGNIELPVGRDLQITNAFSGRLPKNPQIHWREQNQNQWQTAPLTIKSAESTYVYGFKNLRTDLRYRVTGNDAESDEYQITTYVPPEVKGVQVRIDYPEYTHLKPATQNSADIRVVRASTAQIRIEPSAPLSKAKLRFSGSPEELALQPDDQGFWTASLKVTKDADYWIELADAKGHRGGDDKPHHIKAIPDTPPKVEIEDPGQDMRASSTNKLPLKISVADDFGVDTVQVVFHKLGGAEQTITAKRETGEKGEVTAEAELDLSTLDLKEYELLAYHAEAKDGNTLDGPGVGKSPVYFVEVTNLEGTPCKCKKPGQKVNLIEIQKQVIADTTALPSNASGEKFTELATRQRDAKDFGQIYLDTLSRLAAPPAAVTEMQSAVKDMESAGGQLGDRKRSDSIPPEESALAHLYQVLKQLPELQNMPTQPKPQDQKPPPNDKLAVVLDAIKQKKKEQQPENPAVDDALQQAQNLARSQSGLNSAMRHAAQTSGQGESQGQGQPQKQGQQPEANQNPNNTQAQAKNESSSGSKDPTERADEASGKDLAQADTQPKPKAQSATKGKGKGKGKGQGQKQSQANAQGQGQGQGQGKGQGKGNAQAAQDQPDQQMADQEPPQDPAQMADQEQQLSKEAMDLAQKLQRLAGKEKRLGHNAGQNANLAGQKMANASQELKQGKFGAAGVNGFQGELALREVIAQLERIKKDQPELTDVTSEEAPKAYEGLISEYFRKLSHAE